jgi:hypothetical protein
MPRYRLFMLSHGIDVNTMPRAFPVQLTTMSKQILNELSALHAESVNSCRR